jgi:hypothetical protein
LEGVLVYFLNRAFNSEQAVVALIESYLERLDVDDLYKNFHISVTNEHPFAHMIIDSNMRSADVFPSVVVSSQNDVKTGDMTGMPVQSKLVSLTKADIDDIVDVYETVTVKGKDKKRQVPGLSAVAADTTIAALKEACDKSPMNEVYGFSQVIRRTDSISVEIWSDNAQLKNEIYDALKLYISTSLDLIFNQKYRAFAVSVGEYTVKGERGNNFNFDFDVPLYGAVINFEVDYASEQILIDTELEEMVENKDLVWEVINHVKI